MKERRDKEGRKWVRKGGREKEGGKSGGKVGKEGRKESGLEGEGSVGKGERKGDWEREREEGREGEDKGEGRDQRMRHGKKSKSQNEFLVGVSQPFREQGTCSLQGTSTLTQGSYRGPWCTAGKG